MKGIFRIILCSMIAAVLGGCVLSPELVEDSGASAYMKGKYQKVVYSGLEFYISSQELQRDMRVLNDSITVNSKLKESEKKKIRQRLDVYTFTERGYLVFKFKLWSMAQVNPHEFRFEFRDKSGESIIQDILFIPKEVKVTKMKGNNPAGGFSEVYYEYLWAIKLKKQLIPEYYSPGKYKFIIVYPDKSTALYEIKI